MTASEVTSGRDYGPEWSASRRLGTEAELSGWVAAARSWADAADAIALAHFRRDLEITRKPDRTYVTEADTSIEGLIRERIADVFPDHGVLGEEFGAEGESRSVRWYVDPIDGTHNFLRGIPIFATLLAVERDGELQGAVVSAPALGGRWFGWRGGGAWATSRLDQRPRRISVSGIQALAEAQVVYAGIVDVEASGRAPGFRSLLGDVWRERGFGDFWGYMLLAEGATEAVVEVGLSPWDTAAPALIVEEAGGRVTDFEGRRTYDGDTFLATNGLLHEEIRRRLISG